MPSHSKIKAPQADTVLVLTIVALVLTGVIMVFSSSAVYALDTYQDSYYFLKRHILWVLLGTGALAVMRRIDYHRLQEHAYPIMGVTLLLLLAVMVPGLSKEVSGARRWLTVGGLSFQPSELAKFAIILFMAKSLVKRADKLRNFAYGYLPNLIVLGFFFVLILMQPDFGTAVVLATVDGDKVSLVAGVTKDQTGRLKAGELVNAVASQVARLPLPTSSAPTQRAGLSPRRLMSRVSITVL